MTEHKTIHSNGEQAKPVSSLRIEALSYCEMTVRLAS
jgi:hypothetical protein